MKPGKSFYFVRFLTACLLVTLAWNRPASGEGLSTVYEVESLVGILYVKLGVSGDCSSWGKACGLQTAIGKAKSGDEIWVAAGTYHPGIGSDRTVSFQLKTGVGIYGGFSGLETAREHRDWRKYPTILSGDIDLNGKFDSGNAYHVVTSNHVDQRAVLDGFIIIAGNAQSSDYSTSSGGGVYNYYGSPTLANLTITGNGGNFGGGMHNEYSSPILRDVDFYYNWSPYYGGGMYNSQSSPELTRANFSYNYSGHDGGGMYNNANSNPSLREVVFTGNKAADRGAGIFNRNSNPSLVNATFFDNHTIGLGGGSIYPGGGGIYNESSSPTLTNVTLSGNSVNGVGGGIANSDSSSPIVKNAIIWGNFPDQIYDYPGSNSEVEYSNIEGSYAGDKNIAVDPLFVGAETGNLRLQAGSPAIDAGNNYALSSLSPTPTTDLDGSPRRVDIPQTPDTGYGRAPIVDMGAYEAQSGSAIIYVDRNSPGPVHDGTSWEKAFTKLQTALATAGESNEVWVARGIYYPGEFRNASFQLKSGVKIYGGFAGSETTRQQRNCSKNHSYLSGNTHPTWGVTLPPAWVSNSGGAFHVLSGSQVDSTSVLDGFIITGGEASGELYPQNSGGGLFLDESNPTLARLTISNNSAQYGGGGMFLINSNPTLNEVTFLSNSAEAGGGMLNYYHSSPSLTNVTFTNNSAYSGGSMHIEYYSSPRLTNVTFSANSAEFAGGIFAYDSSSPSLTNVTFYANSTLYCGSSICSQKNSIPKLKNAILWDNPPSVQVQGDESSAPIITYSLVYGGYTGTGNIKQNPMLGKLEDNGGFTWTHALLAGSPAIDAGDPTNCPQVDQRGVSRPVDGNLNGEARCDMGAFEFQPVTDSRTIYLPTVRKNN
jgi:hypothetical protein